jgi:threonine/homoserine/homoserine lactone efflux protein
MSLEAWLLFCVTETLLCFAPGPAVLLVVSQSISRGARAGLAASLGILTMNTAYFALSGTSLGAVLVTSWQAFTVIKWVGAGYLIWVGGWMLFGNQGSAPRHDVAETSVHSQQRAFSLAVLTQGANPKALIFFIAILPQFINPHAAVLPQILILGISSVIIEFIVLFIYVGTCYTARTWVGQPRIVGLVQRIGGAFLIGAGVRLAVVRQD